MFRYERVIAHLKSSMNNATLSKQELVHLRFKEEIHDLSLFDVHVPEDLEDSFED